MDWIWTKSLNYKNLVSEKKNDFPLKAFKEKQKLKLEKIKIKNLQKQKSMRNERE